MYDMYACIPRNILKYVRRSVYVQRVHTRGIRYSYRTCNLYINVMQDLSEGSAQAQPWYYTSLSTEVCMKGSFCMYNMDDIMMTSYDYSNSNRG